MMALASILAALAASAALADPPVVVRGPHVRYDPNQIVCRRWSETGSRLQTVRACATRAEWAEHLRLQRQNIEKVQTNRTF